MAWKYSTGLVQKMGQHSSIKEALHDGVIKIYAGAQPALADAAPTGTLLVTITNASGSFTEGTPSTGQIGSVVVATATNAGVYTIGINPAPSEYSTEAHTYTADASATVAEVAAGIAAAINSGSQFVRATWDGTDTVLVTGRFPGQGFTMTEDADPGTDITVTSAVIANARINGLAWGLATGGVLVKEADIVWSGVVAAAGTAGWFRVQANAVDDDSLSTTLVRADGNCGLSNSDMNLTNLNLVADVTVTVSTFTITIPKVAT